MHEAQFRKIKPEKTGKGGVEPMEMPKEIYPHFSIGLEHLPEAKKWDIGKEYYVSLKLKQTSMDMHKGKSGKDMGAAGFDIVGIHAEEHKESKRKERY